MGARKVSRFLLAVWLFHPFFFLQNAGFILWFACHHVIMFYACTFRDCLPRCHLKTTQVCYALVIRYYLVQLHLRFVDWAELSRTGCTTHCVRPGVGGVSAAAQQGVGVQG